MRLINLQCTPANLISFNVTTTFASAHTTSVMDKTTVATDQMKKIAVSVFLEHIDEAI